jgi:hypothetical protein
VLPVNPDLVARRRGPAKKKDDSEDARTCALMALDAYLDLRQLVASQRTGDTPARQAVLPENTTARKSSHFSRRG